MHNIVISDTSCLIVLNKIGELELINKVYQSITTTVEVKQEFSDPLPDWIKIEKVKDLNYQKILETQIDKGEASAIALAIEKESPLLLLDDLKARKLALKLNLPFTGTLGIINKAKEVGVIKSIKPIIEKLTETDFRISFNIIQELLRINHE
jgi:predicted nucleic acid-binding protein